MRQKEAARVMTGPGEASEPTVLVVDDDPEIRDIVCHVLSGHGIAVEEAGDAAGVAICLRRVCPDLILMDIRLPDEDGLSLARRLRSHSNVPIIMLTGLGGDADRIIGLEIGADDYIVKPFNPRELVARVKAVLRRTRGVHMAATEADIFGHDCRRFEGWFLDLTARRLSAPDGRPVVLTNAEYLMLEAFVRAPRQVLSRDQLLDRIRQPGEEEVFDRSIDVLVMRLRRKIEANPKAPRLIRTERGAGYVFDALVERP